ncbi:MAG TPA: hypothetical protein VGV18_08470 [Verrucomicrobiae bacterium]|nr:hypothetical protein [Verrucomicrobiae bacterium]
MPKEIRFSKLVETSGKPETATLWTKPEANPALQKALKQNRVLTVVQHPGAGKKDFGQVGLHPQKSAVYLIFPKALPQAAGARVIGVNYDLIQEPVPDSPVVFPAISKRAAAKMKPAAIPREKKFKVMVERTAKLETTSTVRAKNVREARNKATQTFVNAPFNVSAANVQTRVKKVETVD